MTSKVLVVGSGAMGLRTALELLHMNIPVILRSARSPLHPSTCSMGAGGLWTPYKCDDPRVSDKWALETLSELLHLSKHNHTNDTTSTTSSNSSTNNETNIVELVHVLHLKRTHNGPSVKDFVASDFTTKTSRDADVNPNKFQSPLPKWTTDPRLSFQHLTVEMLYWQNQEFRLRLPSQELLVEAGYKYGWLFRAPIVDPPRMLSSMLSAVLRHPLAEDVDVETGKEYQSLEEMVQDAQHLGCDTVVNCTGLGSTKLCNDSSMVGGRGVLLHYDRSCERRSYQDGTSSTNKDDSAMMKDVAILTEDEPWGSATEPSYIIPRGDVFVVGGTYLEGDTKISLRDEERERLKNNAWTYGIDTERANIVGEWAGFRPCRPMVRLEVDGSETGSKYGVKVIHNYGHGGSGWTTYVGAAKEVIKLL